MPISNQSRSPHGRRGEPRRKVPAFLLAIVPPVALGTFVLWTLHHPSPRVIAPVAIDRNSLLPHHYAGPCINCHHINEIGPVPINSENMNAFSLSPVERALLLAGQRVEVPNLSQRVRIPAITRTNGLPHAYVGVCCNCHVILDVHPSPAFMNEAMRQARQPLLESGLAPEAAARGGAGWDVTRMRNRRAWGYAALLTLLVATAAMAGRRLLKRTHRDAAGRQAAFLTIHEWSAGAFCAAAALHWYYSDRGNNLLHLSLVILSGLSAGGVFLRYRMGDGESPQPQVLVAQRVAFFAFIALLIFGHLFGGVG